MQVDPILSFNVQSQAPIDFNKPNNATVEKTKKVSNFIIISNAWDGEGIGRGDPVRHGYPYKTNNGILIPDTVKKKTKC